MTDSRKIAIYLRLSIEDDALDGKASTEQRESNSISNQRNLTVFVIHGADDLAFCRKDAHIHQRRNDCSFLQQIMFLPVILCLCLRRLGGCHPLFTAGNFSLFRNADRVLPLSIPAAALTKCLFQCLFHKWSHLISFQIFVKYLLFFSSCINRVS